MGRPSDTSPTFAGFLKSDLVRWYCAENMSLGDISARTGVKPGTLAYQIKKAGGAMRPRAAAALASNPFLGGRQASRLKEAEKGKTAEARAKRNQRLAAYRKTPKGSLECRVKNALYRCLRAGKGGKSWKTLVGYDFPALKRHLERQFLKGMSWDNSGDWHIDHIIPLSSFVFETADDPGFRAAWALTNLRPLWAIENIKKARRVLFLV